MLVAEGYLGDLLAVDVRVSDGLINRDGPFHWRHDVDRSGSNTMSLGISFESIMRWVGDAVSVTAMGQVFVKTPRSADGLIHAIRVPDHIDVAAELSCGAQPHFRISAIAGLTPSPEVFLYGSQGVLRFDGEHLYCGKRGESDLRAISIPDDQAGR